MRAADSAQPTQPSARALSGASSFCLAMARAQDGDKEHHLLFPRESSLGLGSWLLVAVHFKWTWQREGYFKTIRDKSMEVYPLPVCGGWEGRGLYVCPWLILGCGCWLGSCAQCHFLCPGGKGGTCPHCCSSTSLIVLVSVWIWEGLSKLLAPMHSSGAR